MLMLYRKKYFKLLKNFNFFRGRRVLICESDTEEDETSVRIHIKSMPNKTRKNNIDMIMLED